MRQDSNQPLLIKPATERNMSMMPLEILYLLDMLTVPLKSLLMMQKEERLHQRTDWAEPQGMSMINWEG